MKNIIFILGFLLSQQVFAQSICDKYSPELRIGGSNLVEPPINYVPQKEVLRLRMQGDAKAEKSYNNHFNRDDRGGNTIGLYSPPGYKIHRELEFKKYPQVNKTVCYVPTMTLTFVLESPVIHVSQGLNQCVLNVVLQHEKKHHQDTLMSYNLAAKAILETAKKEAGKFKNFNLNMPMYIYNNDHLFEQKMQKIYKERADQAFLYLNAYADYFSKTFNYYHDYYASLIDNSEYNKKEMAQCQGQPTFIDNSYRSN
jgi:hypothetical protein